MATLLVTGGAGFIGSCYVLARRAAGDRVINLDKLTYSGNMGNLLSLKGDADHIFVRGDIGNAELVRHLLETYAPDAVLHFAAESHVDRSILDPGAFVRTNVLGTCALLHSSTDGGKTLPRNAAKPSVFCTSPRTKSSARCGPTTTPSAKRRPTPPTVPIRPARRPAIISCAPITKPTASPP